MRAWVAAITAVVMAATLWTAAARAEAARANRLVDEAYHVLKELEVHPRQGEWVRQSLRQAKAVLIVPELLKGAFLIGGESGQGVLLARAPNDEWSYPAFFRIGSASFGLQAGLQSAELLLVIRAGRALSAILERKVKLGADLSAAVGFEGEGVEAGVTTNVGADVVAYSITKGAFLGASVEGSVVWAVPELNTAYYQDNTATAQTIVMEGKHYNAHADKLRQTLATLAGRRSN